MQINVFITRENGESQKKMLVLPIDPKAAIPPQFRLGWVYYVTTSTEDAMFGYRGATHVEAEIASKGFAIIKPEVPDRR